jgi:peptidoglycan/LPS O-acetylase OafA/YrhL
MVEERLREPFGRIATLDGFRALAILSVIAFHYTIRWSAPFDVPPHIRGPSPFIGFLPFEYGWMGVELFFVISGFVILMTLTRSRGPRDFAWRRFARLWPALIVAAALTALAVDFFGPPDWKVSLIDYAASLFVVNPRLLAFIGVHAQWVDGAYWSLWVELRFYVLVAALYFLTGRQFLRSWLACQLLMATTWLAIPGITNIVTFPAFIPYFTIGICVFELWSGTNQRKLAIGGMLLAMGLILFDAALVRGLFQSASPPVSVIANLLIFALFWLFLVDHPILKPFTWKPLVLLGQASYSLYLIHENVGIALFRQLSGIPFLLALPVVVGTCVGASFAMLCWVEIPAKRWLTQNLSGKPLSILREAPEGM